MKMDWQYLKSGIIVEILSAVGISVLISLTTTIPLWISLSVLLFNWPATTVIIEYIASRNPDADKRITAHSWWPPVVTLFTILIITVAVYFVAGINFWTAFGYCTLILTFAGAINGIIAEEEDNAPGVWLNTKNDRNNND
jgi:hypothetical protein